MFIFVVIFAVNNNVHSESDLATEEANGEHTELFARNVFGNKLQERAYIIEVYFHTGMKDNDGNWNYNITECEQQFFSRFPDYVITEYFRRNDINLHYSTENSYRSRQEAKARSTTLKIKLSVKVPQHQDLVSFRHVFELLQKFIPKSKRTDA
ncbi:hypothetical protein ANN_23932 [Periplaneta americana]|uniref:Uncharacterized protein n=1 Tax=Periplaneta americana TaxID=6978 RepID=A0ABQ8S225_PERAM|nr:hypothetical protein ANN_23932 [Periplaneta americana]